MAGRYAEGERQCVHFNIVGLPATQGAKTAYRNPHTGRMAVVEGKTPAARMKFGAWRQAVVEESRRQAEAHGTLDGELHASFTFYLPKPKSRPKREEWVSTQPDFDKLARAVADGLTLGTLIADDARIVECWIGKRYAIGRQPGVEVTLIANPLAEERTLFDGATAQ
jgi:Holliday junction resolvase RusA-like endonuclease